LYAAHPDWSYFDHPPLVGWAQWPLVVLDAPAWLLRLVPELLWLGTALLVYQLAERLDTARNGQAGFWAVLTLSLAPLLHILGIGLLPDTLLMFFTVLVMALTLNLVDASAVQRPRPWLTLGLALGLAGLSKYTAILVVPGVAVCLLAAHGWRVLGHRWLWAALAVALLLVTPVAYWNYANHWISFTYQAKHGTGGGWQVVHVLQFLVVQLLVYGPLLLWARVGVRTGVPGRTRAMLLFFAVPFALLAVLSGGGTSLPHWTAPAWVALAPFAGMGLARAWSHGCRWVIALVTLAQGLLCATALGLMLTGGYPLITQASGQGNATAPSNPFADLHGWAQAGERARALAAQQGLTSVSVQNWTLASRLGWYALPLPVYVLEDRFDQFDLWAGDLHAGGSTLLVDWSQLGYTVPLGAHGFAGCTLLESQDVLRLGHVNSSFRFYACRGWSGQPQPLLAGAK
jgi:4-amino-4-deoxy-L-arabinose transferase-like glycosyltransferase